VRTARLSGASTELIFSAPITHKVCHVLSFLAEYHVASFLERSTLGLRRFASTNYAANYLPIQMTTLWKNSHIQMTTQIEKNNHTIQFHLLTPEATPFRKTANLYVSHQIHSSWEPKLQEHNTNNLIENVSHSIPWIQHISNIVQRRIVHFISIRKTVNLLRVQVDENVVTSLQAVRVRMRLTAPSLIIFPTHKACVHIQIGQ
jgi:hypothetical protein